MDVPRGQRRKPSKSGRSKKTAPVIPISGRHPEQRSRRSSPRTAKHAPSKRELSEALRQSEEWRRALIECSHDGIIIIQDGIVVFANQSMMELGGSPWERVVGSPFTDFVDPGEIPRITEMYRRRMAGEETTARYETLLLHSDGRRVHAEISARRIEYGGKPSDMVIVHDATERRKIEKRLRENKAKLDAVFQSMTDAVAVSDAAGNFIDFNDAFVTFHKFKSKAECYKALSEYSRHVDVCFADGTPAPLARWAVPRALSGETVSNAEYLLRRKDAGETWWGSYSSGPIRNKENAIVGSVVVVRDITERKKVEDALKESEKKYRELVKYAPAGIYEIDLRGRWFTSVNDALCLMLGYTREELLSMNPLDILEDESRQVFEQRMQQAFRGEKPHESVEYRVRAKDGHTIYGALNVNFKCDEQGRPVSARVVGYDITEQKMIESQREAALEALRESEEKFRKLSESSPAVVIVYRDDHPLYVNPATVRLSEYSEAELFSLDIFDLFHADSREKVKELARRRMAGDDGPANYTVKAVTKTGKEKWLDISSSLIRFGGVPAGIVIGIDITERRMSEERITQILDNINDGFFALDREWSFTYINRRAARNVGFEPRELIGKNFWEKFPAMAGSAHESNYRTAMDRREAVIFEMPGILTESWYSISAYPSFDGGISVFWTDITARKQAETVLQRDKDSLERLVSERTHELLRTHLELERARRMADIGRLSATVAHEIRNPLAAIRTAAFNIKRKAQNPLLEKHLSTIDKKVMESDQIIQNLLSFTRIKAADFEHIDILEIINDCITTVSTKYAKWSVELYKNLECGEGGRIEADAAQFRMLVSNLLDNAYQALTAKTGIVTVTARKDRETWKISVADNGEGIDAEEGKKIFEPFYTTRSRGTGLGLTVCREIVELHGGRLEFVSGKGAGSVFTVTLPERRERQIKAEGSEERRGLQG